MNATNQKFDARAVGAQCAKSFSALSAASALLWDHLNGCDFDAWESTRQEFQSGASSAGYLDTDSLWGAVTRTGRSQGLLKAKPKAPTAQAETKANSRKNCIDAAKAAIERGETPAQIFKMAEEAEGKERTALRDKAVKMASMIDSRESDAVKDALKSARDRFEAALKSAREKKQLTAQTYARLIVALEEPKPKPAPRARAKAKAVV